MIGKKLADYEVISPLGMGPIENKENTMQKTISTLVLGLVVVSLVAFSFQLQAQQLPDPERFENEIRRFEEQDRISPPPEGAILLTGSSSIARWNNQAKQALAPLTVIPRGFGGSVMNDVLHYLDRVALTYKPRAVLIYEGDNDTGTRNPIPNEMILDQLGQIIDRIHEQLPDNANLRTVGQAECSAPESLARGATGERRLQRDCRQ